MVHHKQHDIMVTGNAEKQKKPGIRQQKRLFFSLFFLLLTGTFLLFFSQEMAPVINAGLLYTDPRVECTQKILVVIAMAIYFVVTGYFVYAYLSGHSTLNFQAIQHIFEDEFIEETTEMPALSSIEKLHNPIQAYRENKEREKLNKQLDQYEKNRSAKLNDPTTNLLPEKMAERFGPTANYKAYAQMLGDRMDDSKQTLSAELNHARKNAAISLVVGIFFCVVASTTLAYTLLVHDLMPVLKPGDLYCYAPQLLLSLFISFFAFVFLRLYRKNMQNVKHLAHELSQIGLKILSLNTAVFLNEKSMIKTVVENLYQT